MSNSSETKNLAANLTSLAMTNNDTRKFLEGELPKLNTSLIAAGKKITETNTSIAKMKTDLGDAAKEKLAMKRAKDAEDALQLLKPRLSAIQAHTKHLELETHLGNMSLFIEDEVNKDIQQSLESVQDTFANQLELHSKTLKFT